MIQKQKLIANVSKKAKISNAKASAAYEAILKESPSWKKQAVKIVQVEKEIKVKVKVPVELKEITLIREVVDTKEVNKLKVKAASLQKSLDGSNKALAISNKSLAASKKALAASKKSMASSDKSLAAAKKSMAAMKKAYDKKIQELNKKLSAKPKVVTKEIEVIKEVPVEIIKEVEVVKSIDFSTLESMMKNLNTVEVSKKVVGETRTARASKVVERREIKGGTARSKVTGKTTKTTKKKSTSKGKKATGKKASPKKASPKKSSPKRASAKKAAAKKGSVKKVTKKKVTSKKAVAKKASGKKSAAKKSVSKKDNLTKIEGIGPKIAQLLHAGKITSFSALSKAKTSTLQAILDKAGPRFQMHNPGSWAKQAGLAASGKWKELEKLQNQLNGGK